MLANVNLQKDLGIIAMRGRIVVIGNRGTTEINARHAMNKDAAHPGHGARPRHAGRSSPASTPPSSEGSRNGTAAPGHRPGAPARPGLAQRTRR